MVSRTTKRNDIENVQALRAVAISNSFNAMYFLKMVSKSSEILIGP